MPSKLYVGNLAYSVTGSDLEQLFSQAGEVQSATVITDKFSGQSKGFGFVEMASAGRCGQRLSSSFNDTELKGRNIKVNEAKPRESSFGGGNRSGGNRGGGGGGGGGQAGAVTAGRKKAGSSRLFCFRRLFMFAGKCCESAASAERLPA